MAIGGSYAYVTDREGGVRIIDVSGPANLTEVGLYDTPGAACGVAALSFTLPVYLPLVVKSTGGG